MILGMALVSSGFILFFANLQRRQAKKEEKDINAPGTIPTCAFTTCLLRHSPHLRLSVHLLSGQYRIKQANSPDDNSNNSLVTRQRHHAGRETPLTAPIREHHHRHFTTTNYLPLADSSDEGRRMQLTPQRPRGDESGGVDTKKTGHIKGTAGRGEGTADAGGEATETVK